MKKTLIVIKMSLILSLLLNYVSVKNVKALNENLSHGEVNQVSSQIKKNNSKKRLDNEIKNDDLVGRLKKTFSNVNIETNYSKRNINETVKKFFSKKSLYKPTSHFTSTQGKIYSYNENINNQEKHIEIYSSDKSKLYSFEYINNDIIIKQYFYNVNTEKYDETSIKINNIDKIDNEVLLQGYGKKRTSANFYKLKTYWYQIDGSKVKIGCKATYVLNKNGKAKVVKNRIHQFQDYLLKSKYYQNGFYSRLGASVVSGIGAITVLCLDIFATAGLTASAKKLMASLAMISLTTASIAIENAHKMYLNHAKMVDRYDEIKRYGVKK